jgi:hypothetical protein
MLRHQIKLWFEEAVKLDVEHPRELKDTLLRGHPKLEMFFDKLTGEVLKAEEICKKKGVTLQKKTIQDFTYDMTKYFMQGMEGEARRRHETDLQKFYREQEEKKHKEFDKVLAGDVKGTDFEDAGLITNDKIDKQREAAIN